MPPPSISEQFQRISTQNLYAPFYRAICIGLENCNKRGAYYYATCGYRSFWESDRLHKLYLQGKGGRAVAGGNSKHNFWIAVDFTSDLNPDKSGLQPSWAENQYTILGEEMTRLGLVWGGDWDADGVRERGEDDLPHVEWPLFALSPLRRLHQASPGREQEAVFKHLDAISKTELWGLNYPLLVPFLQGVV